MKGLFTMATELGIHNIECECSTPSVFEEGKSGFHRWNPLEVELNNLTDEQSNHLKELSELYLKMIVSRHGLYGGHIKKCFEISFDKEKWYLDGCYVQKFDGLRATILIDSCIIL